MAWLMWMVPLLLVILGTMVVIQILISTAPPKMIETSMQSPQEVPFERAEYPKLADTLDLIQGKAYLQEEKNIVSVRWIPIPHDDPKRIPCFSHDASSSFRFSQSGRYCLCDQPNVGIEIFFRRSTQPETWASHTTFRDPSVVLFDFSYDAKTVLLASVDGYKLFQRTTGGTYAPLLQKELSDLRGIHVNPSGTVFWYWYRDHDVTKLVQCDVNERHPSVLWRGNEDTPEILTSFHDTLVVKWKHNPKIWIFHPRRHVQLLQCPDSTLEGFGRWVAVDDIRLCVASTTTVFTFVTETNSSYSFPLFVLYSQIPLQTPLEDHDWLKLESPNHIWVFRHGTLENYRIPLPS